MTAAGKGKVMLKVEGENRIDIESVADEIASKYGVSDKKALKFFVRRFNTT